MNSANCGTTAHGKSALPQTFYNLETETRVGPASQPDHDAKLDCCD
jgi:hypothetical protein